MAKCPEKCAFNVSIQTKTKPLEEVDAYNRVENICNRLDTIVLIIIILMSRDLHIFTNCNNSEWNQIKFELPSFLFLQHFHRRSGFDLRKISQSINQTYRRARLVIAKMRKSSRQSLPRVTSLLTEEQEDRNRAENDIDNLSWNNEQRRTKFYVNFSSKSLKSEPEIFHANFRFGNCTKWRQPHVKLSSSCRIDFHSRLFRNSSRFGLTMSS